MRLILFHRLDLAVGREFIHDGLVGDRNDTYSDLLTGEGADSNYDSDYYRETGHPEQNSTGPV